jgi:predicted ester cyclase
MCRGTHKGEIMGIAPTGRQIKVPVICINRFKDHQAVETFELIDIFGMLQQLGSA